jgi:GTP-binding protein
VKVAVLEAEFRAGSPSIGGLPELQQAEIALIGRSNVGKSSLINRLTNRAKLSFVSANPGKTQEINLFEIKIRADRMTRRVFLADLPGFGFAKVSKTKRNELAAAIEEYIIKRPSLKVVCILNDSKRLPEEDELALRELAFNAGRGVVVVLTKCDRLKMAESEQMGKKIASAYGLERGDVVYTGDGMPVDRLWERVLASAQ